MILGPVPSWSSRAVVAVGVIGLLAGFGSSAASGNTPPRATLATFAHPWGGHGRGLEITRRGYASENISDGCCQTIIEVSYKLSSVSGTTNNATATFRVLKIALYKKSEANWLAHVLASVSKDSFVWGAAS
jgi:hypothetical protein